MKKLLETFYFGYGILSCAVVINWVGHSLDLKSWYDLLGVTRFSALSVIESFWLFVAYPLLLGASICMLNKYRAWVLR